MHDLFVDSKVNVALHLLVSDVYSMHCLYCENAKDDLVLYFFFSLFTEIDECHVRPDICGAGICYNTADSYKCICDDGYRIDSEGTTCVGESSKVKLLIV